MGIPLEQIERVEVLASSAAGQYGSNAVGGVINIILRRDFRGLELTGYLGGTADGHAIERRLRVTSPSPCLGTNFPYPPVRAGARSEERLGGKECVNRGRYR